MNIFDLNKFQPGSSYTGKNDQQQKPQEQLPIEGAVNDYLKKNNNTGFNGIVLNSSDADLINNHLENYLATDSLRLELQIDRINKEISDTQEQLKALSLLENSEKKLDQQKILFAKRQQLTESLGAAKEEYRQISPLHRFGLWMKDQLKASYYGMEKIKKVLYGKQAAFLGEIQKANSSIKLLAGQVERMSKAHNMQEEDLNMFEVIKQYNKIEQDIETVKNNYYSNQPPDYINVLKKRFQRMYYGYEIPDERYTAKANTMKFDFNFGESKKNKNKQNLN